MTTLAAIFRRWLAAWRASSERLNEYNRQAALQRDRERQEWLMWKPGSGIVQ